MGASLPRCLPLLALAFSACIEGKTRLADGSLDGAGDSGTDVYVPPVQTWVTVEPGTFLMGPRKDNPCADSTPRREVTLTRRYQIGATEVTRRQFEQVMGYTPDTLKREPTCPARVRWYEAAAYCNGLSKKAKLPACYQCSGAKDTLTCMLDPSYSTKKVYDCPGYRLPTEAEWERAYRAGTQTDLYNGNLIETGCDTLDPAANLIAWYCDYLGYTSEHPVGQKVPNSWGLYDMAGNAWEWCADGYQADLGASAGVDPWIPGPVGKYYAQRGGSYTSKGCDVRAVARRGGGLSFSYGSAYGGIRCARSLK